MDISLYFSLLLWWITEHFGHFETWKEKSDISKEKLKLITIRNFQREELFSWCLIFQVFWAFSRFFEVLWSSRQLRRCENWQIKRRNPQRNIKLFLHFLDLHFQIWYSGFEYCWAKESSFSRVRRNHRSKLSGTLRPNWKLKISKELEKSLLRFKNLNVGH